MSIKKKVITTYAKSLFSTITTNKGLQTSYPTDVFLIGEELASIRASFVTCSAVKNFFLDPTISEKIKLETIFLIFPELTITMNSFLKVIAERRHLCFIVEICEEYTKILSRVRSSVKVSLIVGNPLKENYGELLLKTLRRITNSKEILLRVFYNPNLLGGLILEYNSSSIDASVLKEFGTLFGET
jgi:ATP synthase F1 delta subunit